MTVHPHDIGTFMVSSESRPDMCHLVDLHYQEEKRSKPVMICGCEESFIKGHTCKHIRFLVEYLKGLM